MTEPHPLVVKLTDMLQAAKINAAATPGQKGLTVGDVRRVLQEGIAPTLAELETLRTELEALRTQVAARKPAKAKGSRPSSLTDELWIVTLESEPALKGVAVRDQLARAQFWCKQNNRICTRPFFVNWLQKADRTITHPGGKTIVSADANKEPNLEWRTEAIRVRVNRGRGMPLSQDIWINVSALPWLQIPADIRADILKALNST